MSTEAQNNAARMRDEDLDACSSYVGTDAGATGQQNADVLGRLIVDAHAQLDALVAVTEALREQVEKQQHVMEAIKHSLENVVAAKLHDLRQLPEQVDRVTAQLAEVQITVVGFDERLKAVEKDLKGGNLPRLPEGVTRELG